MNRKKLYTGVMSRDYIKGVQNPEMYIVKFSC